MAKKDWYKVTSNAWRQKEDTDKMIYIETIQISNDPKYKYNLFYYNNTKKIILKKMVSRATALKYAKSYMKKH